MAEPMMDYDDLSPTIHGDEGEELVALREENERLREEVKTLNIALDMATADVNKAHDRNERLEAEVERLKKKCDEQAFIIRRVYAEQLPNVWFPANEAGEKDQNGLPKYIWVCPAYGVDWLQVYERTDKTIGGMGS